MPRWKSIPAPTTASRFRSGRFTIATRPSGIGNGCWRSIAAIFGHRPGSMPFLAIAFPVFDPIAIAIAPIAIRWYALAYIGGIVLGWLYARALIKNEKLWGGPAPITLPQMDDFILWVTVGIILGGRTGYVLFYNLPFFIQHPAEIFELWKVGMSLHGGFLGCVAAVIWFCRKNNLPILSLGDITTAVGCRPAKG